MALEQIIEEQMAEWQEQHKHETEQNYRIRFLPTGAVVIEIVEE